MNRCWQCAIIDFECLIDKSPFCIYYCSLFVPSLIKNTFDFVLKKQKNTFEFVRFTIYKSYDL